MSVVLSIGYRAHLMPKEFTTIMLDKKLVAQMREIRSRVEAWTDQRMSWGGFIKLLLAVYEARQPDTSDQVAEMQAGRPMTDQELADAGVEELPGLPITLTEEDRDRIAALVVKKLKE